MPYSPVLKKGSVPKSPTDATVEYYVPDTSGVDSEKFFPTVDHPTHYNTGKIEVIDFITDQNLGFHEGNVVKYLCRAKHKNNEVEDLKKAKWYLDHLVQIKQSQR